MPGVKAALGGVCAATVYNYIKCNNFPKPIRLGPRAVAWDAEEIDAWLTEKKARRDAAAPA